MMRRGTRLLPALLLAALACFTWIPTAAAQPALPGTPTNLQASVNGNALSLTWSAPATGGTPTGYTLVARTSVGGPVLAALPVGNVTSLGVTGPNGVFVISIVATNAAGAGPESTTITVTLPTLPAPPGAPTGLVASALGNTATFSWNAPSSGGPVGNYVLVAGLTPGFAAPLATLPLPASATTTAIPGIPAGTYYVRMLAQNAGGTSAASNEAPFTIAGPSAPGAPTLNQPTVSGNTVGLSWTPGSGGAPTSYVLIARTGAGAPIGNVPLTGTSVSVPGVPDGTYLLQIVAVNSLGTSPVSNTVTLTLPFVSSPINQIGSDIVGTELNFGAKLALSADGSRLVVAATGAANGTTRVYQRSGAAWSQLGGDVVGEASGDRAGTGVAINAAGTRIAVGAYLNDGGGTASGHVRVYDLVGTTWTQVGADLDGDASAWGLGWSVALSGSGNRLVAGAPGNGSTTGRVKVFELVGGAWTQLGATLTAGNEFSDAVDISSDGTTIAVSSPSAAGSSRAGTVQVFRLSASAWTQVGNTLQGEQISDVFGSGLSLSANGSRIAVSAPGDREGGVSGGGDSAGKVRVFDLVGVTWTQVGGDVLGNTGLNGEGLGETLILSDDGTRFAASGAGQNVAKIYSLVSGAWTQVGSNITNTDGTVANPQGLALAADGRTVALGFINGNPKRVRAYSITP